MYKFTVLVLVGFLNISFATDGGLTCESDSLTSDVGDISDILGELTADACNEESHDIDLVNLMKCIPNTINTYEKSKVVDKTCEGVSSPFIASVFLKQLVDDKYPGVKSRTDQSTLVDFMLMEGSAANSSKEIIISELKRNVLQFAHKSSCRPQNILIKRKYDNRLIVDSVKVGDIKQSNSGRIRTDSDLTKELKLSLETDKFKEKHTRLQQKYTRKYGQTIWSDKITQANCSTNVIKQDPRTVSWTRLPSPTCSKRIEINFANDSDKITSRNMGALLESDKFKDLKKCIDDFKLLDADLKVKSIKIDGSANRFTGKNKPGEMKEAIAYNKDLALRRAKSAEDNILERLVGKDLLTEFTDKNGKVTITAKGQHGDGTSGPCPYTTKIDSNGRYSLKPEFKDKDSLSEHRYANVIVIFNDLPAGKQTTAQKKEKSRESHATVACRSYTVSCRK